MLNKRNITIVLLVFLFGFGGFLVITLWPKAEYPGVLGVSVVAPPTKFWDHQCIDTMKFSRDTARAWKDRPGALQGLVTKQMDAIKSLGGNCVAIGTPYDEEFVPFMKVWVSAARAHGLSVWFRGNVSGFEGWFDYPPLTNLSEHHTKVFNFITKHPDMFEAGDIFTPSPESENKLLVGGWTPDKVRTLRSFLVDSYASCSKAFKQIQKPIKCGYFSSNGDVARDAMNQDTVNKTGEIVVIDHYVKTVERMEKDILALHEKYGTEVAIGEFGAPIPDINGKMTSEQRKAIIEGWLDVFFRNNNIVRTVNYWDLTGGSTALFSDDLSVKYSAADAVKKYYDPVFIYGKVLDMKDKPVVGVGVRVNYKGTNYQADVTDFKGNYSVLLPLGEIEMSVGGNGYTTQNLEFYVTEGGKLEKNVKVSIIE